MKKSSVLLKEILARFSPESRARVDARAAELIATELSLAELRKAQKLTQQKLAKLLGIKQESVSSIETRADMLLSTLRGYVKAVGGDLTLKVSFPDRPSVELTTLKTFEEKSTGRKSAGRRRTKSESRKAKTGERLSA